MKSPLPLLEYSLSPLDYSCEYWLDSTEYPQEGLPAFLTLELRVYFLLC